MKGFKELLEECREFVADDPIYYGLELSTKEVRLVVEALEKQVPKKPQLEAYGYSGGELVYDEWFCPKCGEGYEIDSHDYNYCPECGQKIDWSDE